MGKWESQDCRCFVSHLFFFSWLFHHRAAGDTTSLLPVGTLVWRSHRKLTCPSADAPPRTTWQPIQSAPYGSSVVMCACFCGEDRNKNKSSSTIQGKRWLPRHFRVAELVSCAHSAAVGRFFSTQEKKKKSRGLDRVVQVLAFEIPVRSHGLPNFSNRAPGPPLSEKDVSLNPPGSPTWPSLTDSGVFWRACAASMFVLSPFSVGCPPPHPRAAMVDRCSPSPDLSGIPPVEPARQGQPHACDTEAQTWVGLGKGVCCDVRELTLAARRAQLCVHDYCFPCALGFSLSSHELSSCQAFACRPTLTLRFVSFFLLHPLSLSSVQSILRFRSSSLIPTIPNPGLPGCASTPTTYFYVLLS
ncbi:hypothetical protein MAPG_06313 [Magnaporthiopsis poae ATCC 64411]|uniref:Secreted protein n=1 Tax=Magnaporthiopsis poae (strain ATCC 64411 / 73-15) TaxID=644358 RepID=A0A0C4E1P6_MAGP6|nr:hypothetical protein MAPG_06313 [Magnaporthiopsis poae ATCC 64411]